MLWLDALTRSPLGGSSSAEGAGFEPAADISASDRFQGGSDRPLRHPSVPPVGPTPEQSRRSGPALLRAAQLELDVVVGEVVQALHVVRDVGEQPR